MAHDRIHIPIQISVQNNNLDSSLHGCKKEGQLCGAWATGVSELDVFSYDNTGEVLFEQKVIVSAIGCTACQFGRNIHPFEHDEIGSSDKSSKWSLGIYNTVQEAREDAIVSALPFASKFVVDITQQAIDKKDSKR